MKTAEEQLSFDVAPVAQAEKADWDRVLSINVGGAFLMSKTVINQFLAQEPTSGSIVNVGSVASFKGFMAG
jgi:NAD(P)-dependent dehydrogenase (short-subunit alcohol dehydrogenase family)